MTNHTTVSVIVRVIRAPLSTPLLSFNDILVFRNQERRAGGGMELVGAPWGQHIAMILDIVIIVTGGNGFKVPGM